MRLHIPWTWSGVLPEVVILRVADAEGVRYPVLRVEYGLDPTVALGPLGVADVLNASIFRLPRGVDRGIVSGEPGDAVAASAGPGGGRGRASLGHPPRPRGPPPGPRRLGGHGEPAEVTSRSRAGGGRPRVVSSPSRPNHMWTSKPSRLLLGADAARDAGVATRLGLHHSAP